jgi:cytosine/uracil/thiamine/allantoin permease
MTETRSFPDGRVELDSWFVGFGVASVLYYLLRASTKRSIETLK